MAWLEVRIDWLITFALPRGPLEKVTRARKTWARTKILLDCTPSVYIIFIMTLFDGADTSNLLFSDPTKCGSGVSFQRWIYPLCAALTTRKTTTSPHTAL